VNGSDDPRADLDSPDELAPLSRDEAERWQQAVRVAWAPSELARDRHEQILRDALEDPLAEPSPEELREAYALRIALEHGGEHEHLALARALGHALGSAAIEPGAEQRAQEKALARARAPRSNLILVAFGVAASGLALAASVALVVGSAREPASAVAHSALRPSRSLAPLLETDAARLSPSERMDRVASARGRELRENRYVAWGVR
jgi:hypothetical protein